MKKSLVLRLRVSVWFTLMIISLFPIVTLVVIPVINGLNVTVYIQSLKFLICFLYPTIIATIFFVELLRILSINDEKELNGLSEAGKRHTGQIFRLYGKMLDIFVWLLISLVGVVPTAIFCSIGVSLIIQFHDRYFILRCGIGVLVIILGIFVLGTIVKNSSRLLWKSIKELWLD